MSGAEKIDDSIPLPGFDIGAVRAHVTMLHERAKGSYGVLVLAPFGEDPTAIDHKTGEMGRKLNFPCEKFKIGDIERMLESAMAYEGCEHANVYIPLHVMRRDLEPGKRGGRADIIAVLGLVADMDADTGKIGKMPVKPSYIVETSRGNFQPVILLDRPYPPADVAPLAEALKIATKSDSGTGDLAHVWRVPGTCNWPNRKKIERGRSALPVAVRFSEPFTGLVYSVEELRVALVQWIAGNDNSKPGGQPDDQDTNSTTAADAGLIESFLSEELRAAAYKAPPGADRSAVFMSIVRTLKGQGVSVDRIEKYLAAFPDGVGGKYAGRLRREIERAYDASDTKDWRNAGSGAATVAGGFSGGGGAPSGGSGAGGAAGPGAAANTSSNRPTIRIKPGHLESIVDEAEQALINANRAVYQRAGKMVTVCEMKLATFNSGQVIGQRIFEHSESVLAGDLYAAADFEKFEVRKKGWIACDPPSKIVKILSERKGPLKLLILTGIVNVPIIRRDGSIRTKAGYDVETGLLFDPLGTVSGISNSKSSPLWIFAVCGTP
jgi:hypothetical protein